MYVNPIEILGLSNATNTISIDNEIIKKAKRKLFADIDLSDNGVLEYYGLQLTKGNCEKAIDELTNNDIKEFYLYLANNKPLNEFLVNGKEEIFKNFKQDSIFKLPEFVSFISPYFAPKIDKVLLSAFENDNVELTKAILNSLTLIVQADLNLAFKSVSNNIQNKIDEIDKITKDIKNEKSAYDEDDIEEVVQLVKDYFPTNTLNCLPQYFQSQILKIAKSINYLQLSIWGAFDNRQVPNDLLEYLLSLNIGGLERPTFENNYKFVKSKNDERIEQAKNAPVLRRYALYLIQTKTKIVELENKTTTPSILISWVNSTISIDDLNNLPNVFDEIKNQVALSLRAMSEEIWKTFSNIDISIDLINKANNIIGLKLETKKNIQAAKQQLTELKTKIDLENAISQQKTQQTSSNNSKTTINSNEKSKGCLSIVIEESKGCLSIVISLIIILVIILVLVKGLKSISITSDNNSDPKSYTSTVNKTSIDSSVKSSTNKFTPLVVSKYKGNQLKDGASPLSSCFGKGIYNGNAKLTIKNGGNSDAIICLFSISDDRTIRNEYVRKNSNFTMSNIAQGNYSIRVFYGNDWNPNLENSCGTKGNFESDVNFAEFDGTEYFEDNERGYTNATITLYTVAGGNASSSAIDQSKFFSK